MMTTVGKQAGLFVTVTSKKLDVVGPTLLDVAPFVLAHLISKGKRPPPQLRLVCKEALRLLDSIQPHAWVDLLPMWLAWLPKRDPLACFSKMVARGCTPRVLNVTCHREDDCIVPEPLDITDALLTPLKTLPAPQPQLTRIWIHGCCRLTPAIVLELGRTAPHLVSLSLTGPPALHAASGSGSLFAALLRILPYLSHISLSDGANRPQEGCMMLSAGACRALRGGKDNLAVEDVISAGSHHIPHGSKADPAEAAEEAAFDRIGRGSDARRKSSHGAGDGDGGHHAIRHLELSIMDPFAAFMSLSGSDKLVSLNITSAPQRVRANGSIMQGLAGLASLTSLSRLVLSEYGCSFTASCAVPLFPTLATLPALRELLLPLWRLHAEDLRTMSSLSALSRLTLGDISVAVAEADEQDAQDAQRRGLAPPVLPHRYALPPRLAALRLAQAMSPRDMYVLTPPGGADLDDVLAPPPLEVSYGVGTLTFNERDLLPGAVLPYTAIEWFRGAVQLLQLRSTASPAAAASLDDGTSMDLGEAIPNTACECKDTADHEDVCDRPSVVRRRKFPSNQQLVVEGREGRYTRGPETPPMLAPSTPPLLMRSPNKHGEGGGAEDTCFGLAAPVTATLPMGGHCGWLLTLAPLQLRSLELRWLHLTTYDMAVLAASLPTLEVLALYRCSYPFISLPRLGHMPRLHQLYLETGWWATHSNTAAEAADALAWLCVNGALAGGTLQKVAMPLRRRTEMVPAVAPAAGGAQVRVADGGGDEGWYGWADGTAAWPLVGAAVEKAVGMLRGTGLDTGALEFGSHVTWW